MTTDVYIPAVLHATRCRRHDADYNQACFNVPKSDESGYFVGICNHRAKRAGMDNPINPHSLRLQPFKTRPDRG